MNDLQRTTDPDVLLHHAIQGDSDALGTLLMLHRSQVLRICSKRHPNPSIAEELTQETFVNAIRGFNNYRETGTFSHWLSRIAKNLANNKLRDDRMLKRAGGREPAELDDAATITDSMLEHVPFRLSLIKALGMLPPFQRDCFMLVHLHGHSYAAVAKELGRTVSSIRSGVHMSRKRLREHLS
ncbi:MAG TPA: sigma-70 family RNA polymerase sigma factor [Candidatus Paceibacterota bacterium]|nr:sigma-70 family RNA polymerase sigma factor [Candidatus Paceibacterota bacterium]